MVDIPEDGKLTFHVPDGKNSFQISYDGKDCGTGRKTETVDVDLSSKSVRRSHYTMSFATYDIR